MHDEGRLYNPRTAWETVLLLAHGKIQADGAGRTREQAAIDVAAIDLHLHDLRRECASRWWEQRIDLLKISRWLGHADFQMTQRYLQLTDQHFGGRDMEENATASPGGGGRDDPLLTYIFRRTPTATSVRTVDDLR